MGMLAFDIDKGDEVYSCYAIKKEKGKVYMPYRSAITA